MALTQEERLRLSLAEVRQHRPSGEQVILTLELNHPAFDEPARVAADNEDLEALLETGEVVTFTSAYFTATGPAVGESRWPEIALSIDVIASVLEEHLDASLASAAPVTITAREFVRSIALEGPSRVIRNLELDRTTATDLTIDGTAGFFNLDRRFGYTYDPTSYPGLR